MKPVHAALGVGLVLLLATFYLSGSALLALVAGAVGAGAGWLFASWHQPLAIALPPLPGQEPSGKDGARAATLAVGSAGERREGAHAAADKAGGDHAFAPDAANAVAPAASASQAPGTQTPDAAVTAQHATTRHGVADPGPYAG